MVERAVRSQLTGMIPSATSPLSLDSLLFVTLLALFTVRAMSAKGVTRSERSDPRQGIDGRKESTCEGTSVSRD